MRSAPFIFFFSSFLLLAGCGKTIRERHVPESHIYMPICKAIQYESPSEAPVCYRLQEKLVESAKSGDLEGIKEALAKGANIEAGYYSSYPPLYAASLTGHEDAVALLLDNGADPDRVDTFGGTPLKVAAYYGHKGAVEVLIEKGADVCLTSANDDGKIIRPLDTARQEGRKEIEEILVNAGARNCWWKALVVGNHLERDPVR
jgi:hypothetical protein